MKFQNSSNHGFKDMRGLKSVTYRRTNQKQYALPTSSKLKLGKEVGDIKKQAIDAFQHQKRNKVYYSLTSTVAFSSYVIFFHLQMRKQLFQSIQFCFRLFFDVYPTDRSKAVPLLQFFIVCASVDSCGICFVVTVFVPHLSFFWCLGEGCAS